MGVGGILLLCVGLYAVMRIGRRIACGRSQSRIGPLTVLGVVAIIGGLAVFGWHEAPRVMDVRSDRWAPGVGELVGDLSQEFDANEWRSDKEELRELGRDFRDFTTRKWVLISLGTVLVISGAMLAGRGRARPVAFKAFTVLGLAAAAYAMVTFVTSAPRHTWDNNVDRVVKNNRTITIASDGAKNEYQPTTTSAPTSKKPKRPLRAKRPTSRPERRESTEELIAKIPARAGEIPVADELAKPTAKTETTSEPAAALAPATAEPAPTPSVAAAEPATTTEPAIAVAEPTKVPEQPKPAELESAPPPAKAQEPSSEPVKAPAPQAPSAPAVAPIVSPAPPISKTAPKESPIAKPPAAIAKLSVTDRPDWVEKPGKLVDSVYRVSVNSGLYVTVPECQRTLESQMKRAADQYIDDYLGEGASDVVDISPGYLRKHVKKAEFKEEIESETVGPMQQLHALLEFDDGARADFQHRWHSAVVSRRLWHVAASTGLVLALLGTLYGYLRLDLRTGGSHKGQLQLAAALVALIVTAGALLVQSKLPF